MNRERFFSAESFWNTPISCQPEIHEKSSHFVDLLKGNGGFHINVDEWTIPVYYADADTPRYKLNRKITKCPLSQGHLIASQPWLGNGHPEGIHPSAQGLVPIPEEAIPDGENDAHMAVVDTTTNTVYDMWQVRREADGSWSTNSAIAYDLNGDGVFDQTDLGGIHNNESIHYYGPCRASGIPSIAGLIRHYEIEQQQINHKLAFACQQVGLQEFCSPPATWTDGWRPDGIPEGIVIQLDPELDLETLGLSAAGMTVAKALQQYGAVCVDYSCQPTMYAEGLFARNEPRSWQGLLESLVVKAIGFEHYRFLKPEQTVCKGSHPVFHSGISRRFYDFFIDNNMAAPMPILD